MTKRKALRLGCFLLLTLLLLQTLSNLLRDKETTLASLYSEPNHTVEVFFVGSSHVNSALMPGVLAQEYGISAHNVFSWSQPMWISYHYIKEAMKTQRPKVVVLDLYGMLYGNGDEQPQETDRVSYLSSFTIDPGLNYLEMIGTVAKCGIDLRNPADFLNLVRFHSRWKTITAQNFTYSAHRQPSFLKGYGFQTQIMPAAAPAYPAGGPSKVPYEYCVEYLDKIVHLSQKEGFQLVFSLTPFTFGDHQMPYFRWMEDYAAKKNIPLINYCDSRTAQAAGLNWATDMADASHTNYQGALKITRHLGAYLQEKYDFSPVSPQQKADAAALYRVMDIYQAYNSGPAGFLTWAQQHTGATIYALGTAGPLSPQTQEILAQLGFQAQADFAGQWGPHPAQALTPAALQLNGRQFAPAPGGLLLVYYDELLARPVYQFTLTPEGNLLMEEIPSH